MFKKSKMKNIVFMICVTIIIIVFLIAIAWVNSPDMVLTMRFEADNNVLQMVKYLNYSGV